MRVADYCRTLLHTMEQERDKWTEPQYSTVHCVLIAIINLAYEQNETSRGQGEAEAFWRLVELAQNPRMVAPTDAPLPGQTQGTGPANGSDEGPGTDRLAG